MKKNTISRQENKNLTINRQNPMACLLTQSTVRAA